MNGIWKTENFLTNGDQYPNSQTMNNNSYVLATSEKPWEILSAITFYGVYNGIDFFRTIDAHSSQGYETTSKYEIVKKKIFFLSEVKGRLFDFILIC